MKKVMFVMPNTGYSGAEKVVIQIMDYLRKQYDFVYVSRNGRIAKYLNEYNIRHIITEKKLNRKELQSIIEEEKPDIIHATDYRASTIMSTIRAGIPLISHVHNNPPWLKGINVNSISYLVASSKFKKILTVSDSIEREYVFANKIKDKIINVSNPLDRNEILKKVNKESNKKYDICCVGRLCEQKNPLRFINIIEKIKKIRPDISVIMVGDGELEGIIKETIRKKQLSENIKMIGFQENAYQLMAESKVFCLTSEWEGFGLVAFEAITLGLPTYVTPVGGLVDIVNNKAGNLCKSDDEFVEEMIKVINDDEAYKEKSKGAVERSIEIENIGDYMKKISDIYEEILRKRA